MASLIDGSRGPSPAAAITLAIGTGIVTGRAWIIAGSIGRGLANAATTGARRRGTRRHGDVRRQEPMLGATYFEIPVTDLDRAVAFYSQVFGVALERAEIDGNAMALFPEPEDGRGAGGALAQGESYAPSLDGTRVYLGVESIDETLGRVLDRGGAVLYPKTAVGEWGWVAEFRDSEGNRIALSAAEE